MKIEIHDNLRNPQTIEATRVVVFDKFDNPVALAVEVSDGIILTETADNPVAFNNMLRGLGISQTIMLHTAQQQSLPQIRRPGG